MRTRIEVKFRKFNFDILTIKKVIFEYIFDTKNNSKMPSAEYSYEHRRIHSFRKPKNLYFYSNKCIGVKFL